MNLEEFFNAVGDKKIISLSESKKRVEPVLSNEALFQLPFIAIAVLALSKQRSKPTTIEISKTLGDCFEDCFRGFKDSSQMVGWSANLRIRAVTAIGFLEMSKIASVDTDSKKIIATSLGQKVIEKAFSLDSNLSVSLKKIVRSYLNMKTEAQIRLVQA